MKTGKLFGVSVGPGDPELMTLKAVRIIGECEIVAVPRTRGGKTLALDIARQSVEISARELLYLDFDMHALGEEQERNHQDIACQIMEKLDKGKNVAMLNLGDASLYATWSYIERIIADRGYTCETVPGVASFCASAAKLHVSLTHPKLPLRIIPASYDGIESELILPGTKVLMKPGHALPQIKETLEKQALLDKASMVVNCGLENERVLDHVEVLGDEGYFVTVFVDDAFCASQ